MVVGEVVNEVDLLIIGGGPGGYTAAIRASQLGKTVTLVEKEDLGGVCLNKGCIPSKALISAADRYQSIRQGGEMGFEVDGVTINFSKIQSWKENLVKKLSDGVSGLLKNNRVDVIKGEAFFINENEVRVLNGYESNRFRFNNCIISTGSRPIEIHGIPFGARILSSTEALNLQAIPQSLAVIGGGYIGVELSQAYAKLGAKVTILEVQQTILPQFEKRSVNLVKRKMEKDNIDIITNANVVDIEQSENEVTILYEINGENYKVAADYLLVTAGRRPNTDELALDVLNINVDNKGLIEVDEQCRTSIPNIFAIGDIIKGPPLAHKASYEGKVAAEVICGLISAVDYQVIPLIVFSDPEIAAVGFSEEEAKNEQYNIEVGRFSFLANGRALSLGSSEGFMSIIAERETGVILGAEIVGQGASDLISEVGFAIEMGGTVHDISSTIHGHPTLSEVIMETAKMVSENGSTQSGRMRSLFDQFEQLI
ncbi:dihydrolipoyl dehydrogenase [Cytobacillus depressus]|uniref:Dihydrolipoyl dehydrogenase n=1 Tax=Cytobacillus depressus TaxID=1602942 RepID=A0A6L3V2K6_9BACI|nr:dihydrolipoyl dehydrogenase [Cytobacillus depressus]KAB2330483.1 dihydrolipoyl dehydrogenase [Cytobacillus depressus]